LTERQTCLFEKRNSTIIRLCNLQPFNWFAFLLQPGQVVSLSSLLYQYETIFRPRSIPKSKTLKYEQIGWVERKITLTRCTNFKQRIWRQFKKWSLSNTLVYVSQWTKNKMIWVWFSGVCPSLIFNESLLQIYCDKGKRFNRDTGLCVFGEFLGISKLISWQGLRFTLSAFIRPILCSTICPNCSSGGWSTNSLDLVIINFGNIH